MESYSEWKVTVYDVIFEELRFRLAFNELTERLIDNRTL